MQNCPLTQSVADEAAPLMGAFDPTIILNIINAAFPAVAALISMCHPTPTPANYRDAVSQRYRARRDIYAPGLMRQVIAEQKSAAAANGVALNDTDAYTLAHTCLDHVRTGTDDAIQGAMDALAA